MQGDKRYSIFVIELHQNFSAKKRTPSCLNQFTSVGSRISRRNKPTNALDGKKAIKNLLNYSPKALDGL